MESAITSGAARLYEWGGMVTLMTLIIIALTLAVKTLYQRNQVVGDRNHESMTNLAIALERLTDAIKREL